MDTGALEWPVGASDFEMGDEKAKDEGEKETRHSKPT